MELPIDHFRLLGVSPTTDGQTVLRTLQQRLDRAPDQGFTHDTLQARAELLRSSAELLSDEERRQQYERELTAIADSEASAVAGLEIPPSREVGGLLLLMEAGQAQEAFEAASRGLQPPQAPALGSSREADLTLLAGLACQAAAADYRAQRRFETAARTLQQGLQLLQRMGQQAEQRRQLEQELQALLPYRVLDLISRDLSAAGARQEGIALLDQLVQRRGGLEGDDDPTFPSADFQAFFQQIRPFLTVQEQLDLFSRWAQAGSLAAERLASLALSASGFVQRKPERLQSALERLPSGDNPGLQTAMACQLLLLGQVEQARSLSEAAEPAGGAAAAWGTGDGAGESDPLARLCATCRQWLSSEVLPGFRDIDAEPDLEAWFADRDVQAYIAQQDRIRGRLGATAAAGSSSEAPWPAFTGGGLGADDLSGASPDVAAGSPLAPPPAPAHEPQADDDDLWDEPPFWADWHLRERLQQWRRQLTTAALPGWSRPAGAAVALAVVAGGVWLGLRATAPEPRLLPVQPASPAVPPARPDGPTAQQPASPTKSAPPAAPAVAGLPLTAASPDDAQLTALLSAWLEAKADVLQGQTSARPLSDLARPLLISRLERQQSENRSRAEIESFEAQVQSLEIRERSARRIAAAVVLRYSDARRDSSGRVLSRTPSSELRNVYVFARDGETWRVAAFRPGS